MRCEDESKAAPGALSKDAFDIWVWPPFRPIFQPPSSSFASQPAPPQSIPGSVEQNQPTNSAKLFAERTRAVERQAEFIRQVLTGEKKPESRR